MKIHYISIVETLLAETSAVNALAREGSATAILCSNMLALLGELHNDLSVEIETAEKPMVTQAAGD